MIGQIVTHYRILEQLGQGGMGDLETAKETYRQARGHLQNAADGFDDLRMRRSFLETPLALSILASAS